MSRQRERERERDNSGGGGCSPGTMQNPRVIRTRWPKATFNERPEYHLEVKISIRREHNAEPEGYSKWDGRRPPSVKDKCITLRSRVASDENTMRNSRVIKNNVAEGHLQ